MAQALGMLEVYGLVAAFAAGDAGCKAANVTMEPFDKNKPGNADSLPVPLLVMVKFRGSVEDVGQWKPVHKLHKKYQELLRNM